MQVFSEGGQWPGGLFDPPTIRNGDVREGPFDPALSPSPNLNPSPNPSPCPNPNPHQVREGPFDPALSAGAPQVLVRLRVRRVHRTISADPNLNLNT